MAKDYSRTQRIGDSLQQELARLLQFTLSDPRLKMVSVTGVDVSRDLSHAKVFFTQMGVDDAQAAAETTSALDRASGFLRSEIARTATLRTVPKLRFCFDESVGRGRDMETLIRKVRAADIELGGESDSEEDE
ncbi:MAG: 30S ribosome-binding factor RbfA [Halieaceae bacterium]|nr:30S ribosome-binding factor RbfA [Halieaceae bacterium]